MARLLAHDDHRVGQPYSHQWWCKYVDVACEQAHRAGRPGGHLRLKQNRLTRQWFAFESNSHRRQNRWNEPGYGWGVWVPLADLPAAARR